MGTKRDTDPLVRFRLHPATIPPMDPYWWKTESQRLRGDAGRRRQEMSLLRRTLWRRLNENQLGTQCLRGVVVSGHVVDFFFPEARLILDGAPSPRFLGLQCAWVMVSDQRLLNDFKGVMKEIESFVTDRTGVVAYDPARTYEVPPLPACESVRWRSMVEAALSRRRAA
jgi:hypothetical protein